MNETSSLDRDVDSPKVGVKRAGKPKLAEFMLLGSGIGRLKRAGSASREIDYYRALSERFDVSLFEYGAASKGDGLKSAVVVSRNKWLNSVFSPVWSRLSGETFDLVRCKQLWGAWAGLILARLLRRPLIIRCGYIWSRSVTFERPYLPAWALQLVLRVERMLINKADALIFGSADVATYYKKISAKPFCIIQNGFDTEKFKVIDSAAKNYDFIYVGRLIKTKNVQRTLELIGQSHSLAIVGDGPLRRELADMSSATIIGPVENDALPELLNEAKFYISMSLTEGCPKCVYEAILCGLYPVLSRIPAHAEIVEDLGYGVLLGDGDVLPDLKTKSVNLEKLKIFRSKYSHSAVVAREEEFMSQFLV